MRPQQTAKVILRADTEISEKWNFFVNRSIPENFQWENFLGQVATQSLGTQDSENIQQIFYTVLVARSGVIFEIELSKLNHFFPQSMERSDLCSGAQF